MAGFLFFRSCRWRHYSSRSKSSGTRSDRFTSFRFLSILLRAFSSLYSCSSESWCLGPLARLLYIPSISSSLLCSPSADACLLVDSAGCSSSDAVKMKSFSSKSMTILLASTLVHFGDRHL